MPPLDSDQRHLFDKVVLQAQNEGSFYSSKDAAGAVDYALRWEKRSREEEYKEDSKVIRVAAIKAVKESWMPDTEPEIEKPSDEVFNRLYTAAKKLSFDEREEGVKLVQATYKGQKYGFRTRWTPRLEDIWRTLLRNYTDAKLKLPRKDTQLIPR